MKSALTELWEVKEDAQDIVHGISKTSREVIFVMFVT